MVIFLVKDGAINADKTGVSVTEMVSEVSIHCDLLWLT